MKDSRKMDTLKYYIEHQSNKRKFSVNRNCIYIGVKFLHGYMFRLVAGRICIYIYSCE
jgi:hypothetical protein